MLGMTGFWGTQFINEQCRAADWILGLGTRFSEADCSSWEPEYTFNFPPTRLIHIDIDPAEIGRNYPGRDRRRRRPQAGADGAQPRRAQAAARRASQRPELRKEIAANRTQFVAGNRRRMRRATPIRCGPSASWPTCARCCRAMRIITTDVGWNKNGVGQQFPIYTPGTHPHARRLRDDGLRRARGARRQDRAARTTVVVALVGDGGFGQNPALLATAFEEDIAVVWVIMNNCAFGTIAGLEKAHYGTTSGTVFEKNGKPYSPDYAAIAKAYGIDGVRIESAAQFKPALERAIKSEAAVRDRRDHAERAGADRWPLEHHGHLLARQEGASREHRHGAAD